MYFLEFGVLKNKKEIALGEITKIGRKYIWAIFPSYSAHDELRFCLDTHETPHGDYLSGKIFSNKQDCLEEQEYKENMALIRYRIREHSLDSITLEESREILKILQKGSVDNGKH